MNFRDYHQNFKAIINNLLALFTNELCLENDAYIFDPCTQLHQKLWCLRNGVSNKKSHVSTLETN